jgi:hypothetical protein
MKKYIYLLLFSLFISVPVYSKPSHLLKHIEMLSRDYFYIDFSRDDSKYEQRSAVGGEHGTHYYILGFERDIFSISIYSEDENVGYVPKDNSYKILSEHWDDKKQVNMLIIEVIGQQTWVDVSLSAHPFAEYRIVIERLENLN